jgi:hypothetical protein
MVLQPGGVQPGIDVGFVAWAGQSTGAGLVQVVAEGGNRAGASIGDEAAAQLDSSTCNNAAARVVADGAAMDGQGALIINAAGASIPCKDMMIPADRTVADRQGALPPVVDSATKSFISYSRGKGIAADRAGADRQGPYVINAATNWPETDGVETEIVVTSQFCSRIVSSTECVLFPL